MEPLDLGGCTRRVDAPEACFDGRLLPDVNYPMPPPFENPWMLPTVTSEAAGGSEAKAEANPMAEVILPPPMQMGLECGLHHAVEHAVAASSHGFQLPNLR